MAAIEGRSRELAPAMKEERFSFNVLAAAMRRSVTT
jgi:hypothetical protein